MQEKGYIVFQISPINITTNNQLKKYINTQITLIIMDIKKNKLRFITYIIMCKMI